MSMAGVADDLQANFFRMSGPFCGWRRHQGARKTD